MYSQEPTKITIRADQPFYFFQQGKASDTISYMKHDLFYLNIPKDLRCGLRIDIENGELRKAETDTLYRLIHVGAINYTHFYADSVAYGAKAFEKTITRCHKYNVVINGVNQSNPAQITIRFFNAYSDSLLFTNHFYYK